MENKLITEVVDNVCGAGCSVRNIESSLNVVNETDLVEISTKQKEIKNEKDNEQTQ
jgi:hypothetical protein